MYVCMYVYVCRGFRTSPPCRKPHGVFRFTRYIHPLACSWKVSNLASASFPQAKKKPGWHWPAMHHLSYLCSFQCFISGCSFPSNAVSYNWKKFIWKVTEKFVSKLGTEWFVNLLLTSKQAGYCFQIYHKNSRS